MMQVGPPNAISMINYYKRIVEDTERIIESIGYTKTGRPRKLKAPIGGWKTREEIIIYLDGCKESLEEWERYHASFKPTKSANKIRVD